MKHFLLLISFSILITVSGQTDYSNLESFLVTNKGDTIHGKLKYKSGEDIKTKITVKVSDEEKHTFKPDEIKYFYDGDENEYITFEPEGENETFFLRYWVKGDYYNLFEWQVPEMGDFVPYLQKVGDTEYIEMVPPYWKKDLAMIFEDYEDLSDMLWHGKFKIEEMGDAVEAYNDWKYDQENE